MKRDKLIWRLIWTWCGIAASIAAVCLALVSERLRELSAAPNPHFVAFNPVLNNKSDLGVCVELTNSAVTPIEVYRIAIEVTGLQRVDDLAIIDFKKNRPRNFQTVKEYWTKGRRFATCLQVGNNVPKKDLAMFKSGELSIILIAEIQYQNDFTHRKGAYQCVYRINQQGEHLMSENSLESIPYFGIF